MTFRKHTVKLVVIATFIVAGLAACEKNEPGARGPRGDWDRYDNDRPPGCTCVDKVPEQDKDNK